MRYLLQSLVFGKFAEVNPRWMARRRGLSGIRPTRPSHTFDFMEPANQGVSVRRDDRHFSLRASGVDSGICRRCRVADSMRNIQPSAPCLLVKYLCVHLRQSAPPREASVPCRHLLHARLGRRAYFPIVTTGKHPRWPHRCVEPPVGGGVVEGAFQDENDHRSESRCRKWP